jgi:hypothetical protein
MAGVLAVALAAVGLTPWFSPAPAVVRGIAVAMLVAAVALALIAWGLARSVRVEQDDASLDAAVTSAMAAAGQQMCDCAEPHDPDEMHITDADPKTARALGAAGDPQDAACASNSASCAHDCVTCILSASH